MYIERNVPYMFGDEKDKGSRYTNYWIGIRDLDDPSKIIGLMGLEFDMNEYYKLIPKTVIEEPYQASIINLYDANFVNIWRYDDDEENSLDELAVEVRIQEIWKG